MAIASRAGCRAGQLLAQGIQLYYPPVKYAPALGLPKTLEAAAQRFQKHARHCHARALYSSLEDGCRQKALSRDLLRQELPGLNRDRPGGRGAGVEPVSHAGIRTRSAHGARSGRPYRRGDAGQGWRGLRCGGNAAILACLVGMNPRITIQPIIEHPKSLKIAPDIMAYPTVKHVVFGIHDFSKAMGIQITPRGWTQELSYFLHQIIFEARINGVGVIGGVEVLIGQAGMPESFLEPHDIRRWLDLHGDEESRVVYRHACEEAAMGLTGKPVIHPSHIHLCKVAYTPSPTEVARNIRVLKAAVEADALLGGAISSKARCSIRRCSAKRCKCCCARTRCVPCRTKTPISRSRCWPCCRRRWSVRIGLTG